MINKTKSDVFIPNLEELIGRIVCTKEDIASITNQQTTRILNYISTYQIDNLVLVAVLKGAENYANKLFENLIKKTNINIIRDSIRIKSYQGTKSLELKVIKDIDINIENKDILIVEDIEDSGKTLDFLYRYLVNKNPKNIRFSVFIKRKMGYKKEYDVDVGCYTKSNKYLVGFGLDYFEHYRDLAFIAEIKDKYML